MKPYLLKLMLLMLHACALCQSRHDVLIDEIMADPTPQTGLPNNEWIELKNTGDSPINLQNWRIGDATNQSGPMPFFILQPDSFVIICNSSALVVLSVFGTAISVTSFPSLDNEGEQLYLKAADGRIIHSIDYSLSWYRNALKQEGGWTLEMIDTNNPCTGSGNWTASINNTGGTPGEKNSVDAINHDQEPPQLQKAYTTNDSTIILEFNEPLDSSKAAITGNYSIDGGILISSTVTRPPVFNTVEIKTSVPLLPNTIYTVTVNNIVDCQQNLIGNANRVRTGVPSDPVAGEWIINEILFNPGPNAYDYIELLNTGNKILDAARLFIGNRNSSGVISSIRPLSTAPFYIFPGDHIAITEDADNLSLNYLVKNPKQVLIVSSLPSMPDDEGVLVALNFQGEVTDEVRYKDDWHFKLIADAEGVSLERIDPAGLSSNGSNWHSAASTAGYGTPGYQNSQYKQPPGIAATIDVLPKVFSPDNDGRDDIATIQYKMEGSGYVANISIFDASGRIVRRLVPNHILGLTGYWNWDGLDDKGARLPVGSYIIFTEIFNLQGKRQRFKSVVILARKFG